MALPPRAPVGRPARIVASLREGAESIVTLYGRDSDLEAFSHNPTDGSFTALAFQLTVFTNYLNQLFLSY